MTEPNAQFPMEGKLGNTEEPNSPDSQPENEGKEGLSRPADGQKDQPPNNENVPFHKHPAWMRREEEWNDRFAIQQEEIERISKLYEKKMEPKRENVPPWFGGDDEAWSDYQQHIADTQAKAVEEAVKRVTAASAEEQKRVNDATEYFRKEVEAIEADKELNPTSEKIDSNALARIAMDNDLVDSKGRWNWRAAWRLMKAQGAESDPHGKGRKAMAAATTSEPGGGDKEPAFKTSLDFKKNRPW